MCTYVYILAIRRIVRKISLCVCSGFLYRAYHLYSSSLLLTDTCVHTYVRTYVHMYCMLSLPRCHPIHFDFGSSCPLGEEQQLRLKVVNLSGIASSFHARVVHFPAATPPAPPSKPRPSKGRTLTASRTLCANTMYSTVCQCIHFCEDHTYTYTCACVYVCVYTYMYSTLYIRTLYIYVYTYIRCHDQLCTFVLYRVPFLCMSSCCIYYMYIQHMYSTC